MARSKSPAARKAPAKSDSDGAISWGDFNATPMTTPMLIHAAVHVVYATEMMGFQLFDGDNKPSFTAVPACKKYLAASEGCESNHYLNTLYIFFGMNLLSSQILNVCAAFRTNTAFQVTLIRARAMQTLSVCSLLMAGKNIIDPQQFKVGILLQIGLAFFLQNAFREQGVGLALGARDFHKHGKVGYFYLLLAFCGLYYFLDVAILSGNGAYAAEGADTTSATVFHIGAWWAMSTMVTVTDWIFSFEYLSTAELETNAQVYLALSLLGYYMTTSPSIQAAFAAAKSQEIGYVYLAFAAGWAYFGFGDKLGIKKDD